MNVVVRGVTVCVVVGAAVAASRCSGVNSSTAAQAADIVLECAAGDIHHTFRISPAARSVDDLSFSPARRGVADVSDTQYLLQFHERRDSYDLFVQVDRATGTGIRSLFDDEQQAIKGHGGTDDIVCTPRTQ
ncbi:MAG: hypothetical protein ABL982_12635 [Vicinamibacterales bacterium]